MGDQPALGRGSRMVSCRPDLVPSPAGAFLGGVLPCTSPTPMRQPCVLESASVEHKMGRFFCQQGGQAQPQGRELPPGRPDTWPHTGHCKTGQAGRLSPPVLSCHGPPAPGPGACAKASTHLARAGHRWRHASLGPWGGRGRQPVPSVVPTPLQPAGRGHAGCVCGKLGSSTLVSYPRRPALSGGQPSLLEMRTARQALGSGHPQQPVGEPASSLSWGLWPRTEW